MSDKGSRQTQLNIAWIKLYYITKSGLNRENTLDGLFLMAPHMQVSLSGHLIQIYFIF